MSRQSIALSKEGWHVPGSRVNGKGYVEIKVYHFTGVQAALEATEVDTGGGDTASPEAEANCFISNVAE